MFAWMAFLVLERSEGSSNLAMVESGVMAVACIGFNDLPSVTAGHTHGKGHCGQRLKGGTAVNWL